MSTSTDAHIDCSLDPFTEDAKHCLLLSLPNEILVAILQHLTTPSFVQTVATCHRLFDLVTDRRDLILHHLHQIPGIKLGLEDPTLSTNALFLILRQRAAANLYGANFNADCRDLRFSQATLDPAASCLTDTTDSIGMSLVLKESLSVRQYSSQGFLKIHDPVDTYDPGVGRIIQVVHWKSTISVLYEQHSDPPPCSCCPNSWSRFHPLQSGLDTFNAFEARHNKFRYYLIHYNAYTNDSPDVFHIPPPAKTSYAASNSAMVPQHLAVHNRLKCAIVWGSPIKTEGHRSFQIGSKTYSNSKIILYVSNKVGPNGEASGYDQFLLYPLRPPSSAEEIGSAHTRQAEYMAKHRPRALAFVAGGKNLKLYRAGSLAPYAILPSTISATRAPPPSYVYSRYTNEEHIRLETFKLESPFYGQHVFEEQTPGNVVRAECTKIYLHIATGTPGRRAHKGLDTAEADIYIIQNRVINESDDCDHVIDLGDMGRVPFDELQVVARLWGWNSDLLADSSATALESVCVSPNGTRIAVACWDRILIWSLSPEILCEEWVQEERRRLSISSLASSNSGSVPPVLDAQGAPATSINADNSDTSSIASSHASGAPNSTTSDRKVAMVKATKFYDLVRHHVFGEIVELKPIVLKLPGSCIARKMMWRSAGVAFEENPVDETDLDYELGSSDKAEDVESTSSHGRESDNIQLRHRRRELDDSAESLYGANSSEHDLPTVSELGMDEKQDIKSIGIELEKLVVSEQETLGMLLSTVAEENEDQKSLSEVQENNDVIDSHHATSDEVPPLNLNDSNLGMVGQLQHEANDLEATAAKSETLTTITAGSLASPQVETPPRSISATHLSDRLPENTPKQASTTTLEHPVTNTLAKAPASDPGDVPEPQIPQVSADQQPVQPDGQTNFSHDLDGARPLNLDFSTLDNSDILLDFDFDGFLNTHSRSASPPGEPNDLLTNRQRIRQRSRERPLNSATKDKPRKRKLKRDSEDELVVLTDRGVQIWNLGVWGTGKRETGTLD